MKKLLSFCLLFCFLSPVHVYADEFENSGDSIDNQFLQTISYGLDVSHFSSAEEDPFSIYKNIEFTKSDIQGETLEEGLARGLDSYIGYLGYSLGDVRGAFAFVPPEGYVHVLYHYKNLTGHDVDIKNIIVAYSQKPAVSRTVVDSFIEREKGSAFTHPSLQLLHSGILHERGGVLDIYDGIGVVPAGGEGVVVIERIKMKNPLEILSTEIIEEEGGVRMKVKVRNNGFEDLKHLIFVHVYFQESFDLGPGEVHELEYFVEWDYSRGNDLGYFGIRNNNSLRLCSGQGVNWHSNYSIEGVTVFGLRDNNVWSSGSVLGPAQYSPCIERLPYTMGSKRILLGEEEEGEDEEEQEQEQEQEGDIEEVPEEEIVDDVVVDISEEEEILGVSSEKVFILPKSGSSNGALLLLGFLLLVVDVFLWYSVLRKRNERKNIFTKICAKSRKNSCQRRL